MDETQQEAITQYYAKCRTNDFPGWTTAESYLFKQQRISEALAGNQLPRDATFLELGCGAGNITCWMATHGYRAFGIDAIPTAIAWAEERASKANTICWFVIGELLDMNAFADDSFDIIYDGDCLHIIAHSDRERSLSEIRRVLRPGGVLITGGNTRDAAATNPISFANGSGRYDPFEECLTMPDGIRYFLFSETQLLDELRNAGFEILRVHHLPKRGNLPCVNGCISIHATK